MRSLKIAQVTPYYYPSIGGVSGVTKYIAEELVIRGHNVDVITAHKDHAERPPLQAPKFEVINGVNIYRYKSIFNIGHMSIVPSMVSHLIQHDYNVIHYHSYRHPLCDISAFIGHWKKCVNVLHGHGPFFEKGEIGKGKHLAYHIYDIIAKRTTLKWSHKIIALNRYELENFKRILSEENKIIVIPNSADSQSFSKTDSTDFIAKHNLADKKIILCLGILNEAKRQDLLIEALSIIIKEVPDAFLVLVGPDGRYLQKVRETARRLNIDKYYKFIGPLMGDDKHKAYDAASIFALSSDKDAYPLVIAEAMAHHLPVVTTNARGPKDMVHDGIDGIIVQKRDVYGIASAIIKLLKDDKLRIQMSKNARLNAEKNHSVIGVVDQLEAIYYRLIINKKTLN